VPHGRDVSRRRRRGATREKRAHVSSGAFSNFLRGLMTVALAPVRRSNLRGQFYFHCRRAPCAAVSICFGTP
jgi:hypothetical protein